MGKEFVPYEVALRLKELGFDEPCIMGYFKYTTSEPKDRIQLSKPLFRIYGENYFFKNSSEEFKDNSISGDGAKCSAPLYQQAFRWFREKYNLDSFCRQTGLDGTSYWKINKIESDEKIKGYSGFTASYRGAELVCLDKLLEIVESRMELPVMIVYTEELTADEILEKYGKVLTEEQIEVLNNTKKKTNG